MTAVPDASQTPPFSDDARVRIPDLPPQRDDLSELYIAAQVVLIWPYSSSTRKFSLLLSEADARPLQGRKQVKVTFFNGAARAVQDSRVGIGDAVRLRLTGCQWAEPQDVSSTPGKRIDWDITFRKEVAFEIKRNGTPPQYVQYQSRGTPSPVLNPVVNGVVEVIQDLQIGPEKISIPFVSPSVPNVNRTPSSSYFDSPLDPFAEDKDYVFGRSRKRTKFARPSGDWKLIDDERDEEIASPLKDRGPQGHEQLDITSDEPEIPEIQTVVPEVIDLISPTVNTFPTAPLSAWTSDIQAAAVPLENASLKSQELMRPPQPPAKTLRWADKPPQIDLEDSSDETAGTTTPRLMPMPSPSLPLVSPLIHRPGVETGYFPLVENGISELDASAQPEEIDRTRQSSIASSSEESVSAESLVVLGEPPKVLRDPIPSTANGPDALEDEDMYGAPKAVMPDAEPEKQSAQRSRDALDVLEQFLQVSPTVRDEPYHVEDEEALLALSNGGASAEERHKPEALQTPVEQKATGVELEDPQSPLSRVQRASSDFDNDPTAKRYQSPSLSLDGAVDEDEIEPAKHVKTLQEIALGQQLRSEDRPEILPQVAQRINTELKPALDDAARILGESRHDPLTPAQTQEPVAIISIAQPLSRAEDVSLLPTPDNSQIEDQLRSSQILPSQDEIAVEEKDMMSTDGEPVALPPRRFSQRLSRRSVLLDDLSSPYFTPRKPAQTAATSLQARDATPPQSSPPDDLPSSPTRPLAPSSKARKAAPRLPPVARVSEAQPAVLSPVEKPAITLKSGTNTSLSYYPALASLREHFGQSIDLIALAFDDSSKPERAKSGPKEYHTTLRLVDSSLDSKTKVPVQVFRHARDALPVAHRGDVVILRNFKVQTAKHKWMLLSTDTSAWAVFGANPNARSMFDDVTMSGPPVEYGRGETAQVKKLVQWWHAEGEEQHPAFIKTEDKPVQNGESSSKESVSLNDEIGVVDSIEPPPLSPRRLRRRNNMTDNYGNQEDLSAPSKPADRDATTPTSVRNQPPRRAKSKTPARNGGPDSEKASARIKRTQKSPNLVHELRDGTKYVDDGKVNTGGVVHELRDGRNYVDE